MSKDLTDIINYHIENGMLLTVERNGFEANIYRGFPIKVTDSFLFMTNIVDFHDEGFIVMRKADISDAYSKENDSFYEMVCIGEGLRDKIYNCPINNLKDIKMILSFLDNYDEYITIHCEKEIEKCDFFLGKIQSVKDDYIEFLSLGIDGDWNKEFDCIPYDNITMITVGDHYSKMFYKWTKMDR